jgi:Arginyl tRNA synthetase N terminal domain
MAVWAARTFAFSVGKRFVVRPISYGKVFMSTSSAPDTAKSTIRGIEFVQDAVVNVLNNLFDPAEVARNNALAKLDKPKKQKKQKKNQEPEQTPDDADTPKMSEEAKQFATIDAMVTAATKMEFGDYQINAAMGLAKAVGMAPR